MIAKEPPRMARRRWPFPFIAPRRSLQVEGSAHSTPSKGEPGMETASVNIPDFCLVVLANDEAVVHASETVRSRFAFLPEEMRMTLVSAAAERGEKPAEHGDGGPIAVSISLEADVIQGTVSTEDDTGEGTASRFEISLSDED